MGARGPGAKPVKARPPVTVIPGSEQEAGRTRAERLVNWIEGLIVPSGQLAGKPFRLMPWQKRIIRELYRTDRRGRRVVRTGLVSLARKNGKSGLAAALALAHLAGPEAVRGGQVLSGAADRGQAGIIFEAMKAMALASPALRDRLNIKVFSKQIEDTETGSTYAALSSDARKAHGTSPSFFVCDEVAQWRGRDLLDALRTGMGAHSEPLGIIISTRSPDPDNPLEELIRYAADVEAGAVTDPSFRAFVHTAPAEADPWSEATWRLANPALGTFRSLEDVRVLAQQARRVPSLEASFMAYTLNMPVVLDDRWLAPADWDACAGQGEPDGPCWAGLDLSAGPADLTAFTLYWPASGALRTWAFLPAEEIDRKEREDRAPYRLWQAQGHVVAVPGRTIDRAWLGAWIARQTDALELQGIATDRWLIEDLKAQMDRERIVLPFAPHGAGFKDVSPSLAAFEALVLDGTLHHGGNPALRWSVANAAIDTDPAGNRKLSKQRARGRIDPLVSAVYAIGLASRMPAAPRFEFTGMLVA